MQHDRPQQDWPGVTGFAGYLRQDGSAGTRNLLLVVALIDLANDVTTRIADALPGAVALLTPGGGLSFGAEAALLDRLRRRFVCHPNVGALLVVGPVGETLRDWCDEIIGTGRLAGSICISDERDSVAAVTAGLALGGRLADALGLQQRSQMPLSALRVGLRSSSSSLVSAMVVNPTVGAVVDIIVRQGGGVAFSELADLAGGVEALSTRADAAARAALQAAMAGPVRLLTSLGDGAPDPTPTNLSGGIATLAKKAEGALRRLGCSTIHGVFGYGEAMAATGLQLMDGPGSAAISLVGLAAAGCTMILYTVGMTSITVAAPLSPVVTIGPPALAASRDLDLHVPDPPADAACRLLALLQDAASGRPTAAETLQGRHIMLPAFLPPL